jgi:hypothetical protein
MINHPARARLSGADAEPPGVTGSGGRNGSLIGL